MAGVLQPVPRRGRGVCSRCGLLEEWLFVVCCCVLLRLSGARRCTMAADHEAESSKLEHPAEEEGRGEGLGVGI